MKAASLRALDRHGPPLAWAALLFHLSSAPLTATVPGNDKVAHVVAYAILGALVARSLFLAKAWRLSAVAALAAALAALYGVSDELHQSFVPGRTADGADVVADAVGAILGAGAGTWTLAALDRWARGAGAQLALARRLRRPASRCNPG